MRASTKLAGPVLRILFSLLFYGTGAGNDTGAGCIGFSYGMSYGKSYGLLQIKKSPLPFIDRGVRDIFFLLAIDLGGLFLFVAPFFQVFNLLFVLFFPAPRMTARFCKRKRNQNRNGEDTCYY